MNCEIILLPPYSLYLLSRTITAIGSIDGESVMANTPGNEPSLEAAGTAVLHAPPTSTYQAWSRSFVEMYTIAHEWTIENFIELDEEASVCFKVSTRVF